MKTQETPSRQDVTRILEGAEGLSREQVFAQLAPVVYDELRMLAAAHLRSEDTGHSLQPTALVNEALLTRAHELANRGRPLYFEPEL